MGSIDRNALYGKSQSLAVSDLVTEVLPILALKRSYYSSMENLPVAAWWHRRI